VHIPIILAGMKQGNQFSRIRIDACDVRPFAGVAAETTQTEIVLIRRSPVLLRDYVIDGKSEKGILILMDKAVFATKPGAFADRMP
jgi:hypothetical protein